MIWNHNRGHPADCTVIVEGNIVHSGNGVDSYGKSTFSNTTVHRTPPHHQCWPRQQQTSTKERVPTFTKERYLSSEQMTQLIDYLHYAADALITHAHVTKKEQQAGSSTHTHVPKQSQQRRRLLHTRADDDAAAAANAGSRDDRDDRDDRDNGISSESLLQVVHSIDMASQAGVGIRMQTIYENIVNPIVNAVAEQLPQILFLLIKFPLAIQMRDSLVQSLKSMMTNPTLGNLDPQAPPLDALLEESNAQATTNPGPADSPGEGIGNTLGMQIADSVTVELSDALWKNLKIKLEDSISNSVTRQTVRSLNHILTGALSHSISRMMMELVSKSLTRSIAKETNKILIPSLTQSISETVTHALTRNPKSDYYCHYCELHQLYCDLCRQETTDNYNLDWKIAYYSKYYGNYYSWYYSNTFVDAATDEYLHMGKREV